MAHARAQIASLDLVISISVLLFVIAVLVTLFPSESSRSKREYGSRVFTNIEQLEHADIAFLSGYNVNEQKLADFAALPDQQIEALLLNSTNYNHYTSDTCMFFLKSASSAPIGGRDALGRVYTDDTHTSKADCSISSPCPHYGKIAVFVKPVVREDAIMNLYVIVCTE